MEHDADYIDAQEFMGMPYWLCIQYLQVFFEGELSITRQYFSTDGVLESDILKDEFEDKIIAMVTRGYLKSLSNHYALYCITEKGHQLVKKRQCNSNT